VILTGAHLLAAFPVQTLVIKPSGVEYDDSAPPKT
jgi:hypothetical protein